MPGNGAVIELHLGIAYAVCNHVGVPVQGAAVINVTQNGTVGIFRCIELIRARVSVNCGYTLVDVEYLGSCTQFMLLFHHHVYQQKTFRQGSGTGRIAHQHILHDRLILRGRSRRKNAAKSKRPDGSAIFLIFKDLRPAAGASCWSCGATASGRRWRCSAR